MVCFVPSGTTTPWWPDEIILIRKEVIHFLSVLANLQWFVVFFQYLVSRGSDYQQLNSNCSAVWTVYMVGTLVTGHRQNAANHSTQNITWEGGDCTCEGSVVLETHNPTNGKEALVLVILWFIGYVSVAATADTPLDHTLTNTARACKIFSHNLPVRNAMQSSSVTWQQNAIT